MIYAAVVSGQLCVSALVGVNTMPGVMQGYDVPDASWLRLVNGAIVITDPATDNLIAAKNTAKNRINTERDRRETIGFPYMSKTLQSDERSVQRITVAVQAAQAALSAPAAFSLTWTCADNTELTVDGAQMVGMAVALATNAATIHGTAKALKTQIAAATTQAAVEAIVWP